MAYWEVQLRVVGELVDTGACRSYNSGMMDQEMVWDLTLKYGGKILLFLLGIFATWLLSKWATFSFRKVLERAKLDLALQVFLSKLLKWTILVGGLVSCLGIFGIQTASFAAVFAGAGLAIGMALQGTLGHFAAGICLLILRPFRIGDVIQVSGDVGTVAEIDIFNTAIDTLDNRRIIIPNGDVFGSKIENITAHPTRRVDVTVGVAYEADLGQTRQTLLRAAVALKGGLKEPSPQVVLLELGSSSVNWVVRLWAPTKDYFDIKDALTESIKVELDRAQLSIPFPQMDVHVKSNVIRGV